MVWLYVILAAVVVSLFGFALAGQKKPRYGLVIDKKTAPDYLRETFGYQTRATMMIAGHREPAPLRYQLLLSREGERPNWVDVTEEQYRNAHIGQVWPSDA